MYITERKNEVILIIISILAYSASLPVNAINLPLPILQLIPLFLLGIPVGNLDQGGKIEAMYFPVSSQEVLLSLADNVFLDSASSGTAILSTFILSAHLFCVLAPLLFFIPFRSVHFIISIILWINFSCFLGLMLISSTEIWLMGSYLWLFSFFINSILYGLRSIE